jgi:hypothetical protein
LEKEWDAFIKSCGTVINNLHVKEKRIEEEAISAQQKLTQLLLQAGNQGLMIDPLPRFAHKAFIKLKYLVDGKDGQLAYNYQKKIEAIAETVTQNATYENNLDKELEALNEKYEDRFGEGKENPFDAACADDTKVKDTYLASVNTQMEQNFTDYLNFLRRKINDEVYYYQYTMWPENFELAKVLAQLTWLNSIKSQQVTFKDKSGWCQDQNEEEEIKPFKLQAFDDVACKYNSEMDLKIIKFTNNCSRMTSEFDFMFLNYVRKDDFERAEGDTYISSTIKISAEAGKELKAGPLKVEAKVGGGVELEIGRQGLEDVVLIGEAKVGIGTDVMDANEKTDNPGIGIAGKDAFSTTKEAGVEGRISIISGKGSVSGTGVLKDIKMSEW